MRAVATDIKEMHL